MSTPSSELLRIDPLTECRNYLGFLETLTDHSLSESPGDRWSREALYKSWVNSSHSSAILFVEMNHIKSFNESRGYAYGDSVIRWMGILLREECNAEVYRLGGVEFAVLLKMETREEHSQLLERIHGRIEREAALLGFPSSESAADIALVFFDETPTSLSGILMIMGEAMISVKNNGHAPFAIFHVTDFKIHAHVPTRWKSENESDVSFAVRWISLINIYQVLELGRILDETQQDAFTDAISSLPNMKAALLNMEQVLQDSLKNHKSFSVLLIDGDNTRIYNSINYAAGDEMIRDTSTVFRNNLRPSDFVARWRSGDEFVVILPDTPSEGAKVIAERFRMAVKEASQTWRFPVTISIGIASYPVHGEDVNSLIDKAEAANKRAKDQGKDQAVLAD